MTDLPWHPVLVHFPIALGVVLPLMGFTAWLLSKKFPQSVRPLWALISVLCLFYLGTAYFAMEAGEDDEHKVEAVVGHEVLHEHEEAGEKIPWVAAILFLGACLVEYFHKKPWLAVVWSLAATIAIAPLYSAGHSGGELIYKHGAAQAHVPAQKED